MWSRSSLALTRALHRFADQPGKLNRRFIVLRTRSNHVADDGGVPPLGSGSENQLLKVVGRKRQLRVAAALRATRLYPLALASASMADRWARPEVVCPAFISISASASMTSKSALPGTTRGPGRPGHRRCTTRIPGWNAGHDRLARRQHGNRRLRGHSVRLLIKIVRRISRASFAT